MDKKTIIERAKKAMKQLQQMQEDLKHRSTFEKLTFPEPEAPKVPQTEIVRTVDISAKSAARATLVILGILALSYFLYEIKGLLALFFVSIFFASALDPSVDWLEKRRIPRAVGVVMILLMFFSLFVVVIGSAIPIIIEQITLIGSSIGRAIRGLFENLESGEGLMFLPESGRLYIQEAIASVNLELIFNQILENLANFTEQIKDLASGVGSTVSAVGAGVTSLTINIAEFLFRLVLVFFLVFFMVVDKNNMHEFFQSLFPKRYSSYISNRIAEIQKQIGAWLRGMFLLSFIMFLLTFIGLHIIGMKEYALTLSLVMGVAEMIPYIGPLIFLVFSLPLAFGISLMTVLKLIIFYVVIQAAEGNILVPAVMKRVVGLSPIIVLMVLLVGWHFMGITGAVIAVPVTTAVAMFVRDYTQAMRQR